MGQVGAGISKRHPREGSPPHQLIGNGGAEGIAQLADAARPGGYTVEAIEFDGVPATGGSFRCASATMRMIRASNVSEPTRSARMVRAPVPFKVPPVRGASAGHSAPRP